MAAERRIREVGYETFMEMTESRDIGKVEIDQSDNEILFTNKDGEQIVGMNIFVAFKDENVHGLRAEKFFLKEGISLPEQVKVN